MKTKEELLVCYKCLKDSNEDPTVKERNCAYYSDIHGEEHPEIICDDCEYEHIMDI